MKNAAFSIEELFRFLDAGVSAFHSTAAASAILEAEGYMSISNNSNNELVCTVKIGPDTYRKNYIYLNDYTMYVVEDITGTHTDPYHYKLYFHTDILPSVEVKP